MRGTNAKRCVLLAHQALAVVLLNWSCRRSAAAGSIGECVGHSECGSEQFCMTGVCQKDGFDLPCTWCADCPACTTSVSVDRACPDHCPVPSDQLVSLQGVFTQLDEDGCISVWFFEHDNFRRFESSVPYADALGFPGAAAHCSRTGGVSRIQSGHFVLRGYSMSVWLPNEFLMVSYDEVTATLSLIPWGIRLTWASGEVDDLIQYQKPEHNAIGGLVRPIALWVGSLSMFQTDCNVSLQLYPAGADTGKGPAAVGVDGGKLYFWKAVTWKCVIGPKLAPGMEVGGRRSLALPRARNLNTPVSIGPQNVSFVEDLGDVYTRWLELDSSLTSEWCLGGCTNYSVCWLAEISEETQSAFTAANITFLGPELVTSCECLDAFLKGDQLDEYQRRVCTDRDECLEGTDNCPDRCEFGMSNCSICANTVGSFACSCHPVLD